jgi:hypothetical protein
MTARTVSKTRQRAIVASRTAIGRTGLVTVGKTVRL